MVVAYSGGVFCYMEYLKQFIDLFLHLDAHLGNVIKDYGTGTYIILFCIIFCETGLVITPFLPGDSLLFAVGAFAARGSLNLWLIMGLLLVAAVLGDAVNYAIGRRVGPQVFRKPDSRIFRKEYLERTQKFYDTYGGKTIVIARFVPIVRTFAPFLAGVGEMNYATFALYNISGAILWISSLTLAGYYFSELPMVRDNFGLVIIAIIVISILPAFFEILKARREKRAGSESAAPTPQQRASHG